MLAVVTQLCVVVSRVEELRFERDQQWSIQTGGPEKTLPHRFSLRLVGRPVKEWQQVRLCPRLIDAKQCNQLRCQYDPTVAEFYHLSIAKLGKEWLQIVGQFVVVARCAFEPKIQQRLSDVAYRVIDGPPYWIACVKTIPMRQGKNAAAYVEEDGFMPVHRFGDGLQPPSNAVRNFLQNCVWHGLDKRGKKSPGTQYLPFLTPSLQCLSPASSRPKVLSGRDRTGHRHNERTACGTSRARCLREGRRGGGVC